MLEQEQYFNYKNIKSRLQEFISASQGNASGTVTEIGDYLIINFECAIKKQTEPKYHLTLKPFNR